MINGAKSSFLALLLVTVDFQIHSNLEIEFFSEVIKEAAVRIIEDRFSWNELIEHKIILAYLINMLKTPGKTIRY